MTVDKKVVLTGKSLASLLALESAGMWDEQLVDKMVDELAVPLDELLDLRLVEMKVEMLGFYSVVQTVEWSDGQMVDMSVRKWVDMWETQRVALMADGLDNSWVAKRADDLAETRVVVKVYKMVD